MKFNTWVLVSMLMSVPNRSNSAPSPTGRNQASESGVAVEKKWGMGNVGRVRRVRALARCNWNIFWCDVVEVGCLARVGLVP